MRSHPVHSAVHRPSGAGDPLSRDVMTQGSLTMAALGRAEPLANPACRCIVPRACGEGGGRENRIVAGSLSAGLVAALLPGVASAAPPTDVLGSRSDRRAGLARATAATTTLLAATLVLISLRTTDEASSRRRPPRSSDIRPGTANAGTLRWLGVVSRLTCSTFDTRPCCGEVSVE